MRPLAVGGFAAGEAGSCIICMGWKPVDLASVRVLA